MTHGSVGGGRSCSSRASISWQAASMAWFLATCFNTMTWKSLYHKT